VSNLTEALAQYLVAAVATSTFVTWVVRAIALRRQLFDQPNERSAHTRPTPRLGGIGIMVAFLCAATVRAYELERVDALVIIAATFFISAVGLVDDLMQLPARVRIGAQCIAAAVVIAAARHHLPNAWSIFGALPLWALVPLSFLWIVWLTNLYNFMDGIDGLAGGQAVIASLGIAAAAFGEGAQLHGMLALILAAAVLGFMLFNFPPASIFMGDVGSTAIGFFFASLPFLGGERAVPVEAVAVALALFILDATITLFRRMARGERLSQAHRTHYYQRPLAFGIPHRRVTMTAWAGMLLTAAACAAWPALGLSWRLALVAGAVTLFLSYVGAVHIIERPGGAEP